MWDSCETVAHGVATDGSETIPQLAAGMDLDGLWMELSNQSDLRSSVNFRAGLRRLLHNKRRGSEISGNVKPEAVERIIDFHILMSSRRDIGQPSKWSSILLAEWIKTLLDTEVDNSVAGQLFGSYVDEILHRPRVFLEHMLPDSLHIAQLLPMPFWTGKIVNFLCELKRPISQPRHAMRDIYEVCLSLEDLNSGGATKRPGKKIKLSVKERNVLLSNGMLLPKTLGALGMVLKELQRKLEVSIQERVIHLQFTTQSDPEMVPYSTETEETVSKRDPAIAARYCEKLIPGIPNKSVSETERTVSNQNPAASPSGPRILRVPLKETHSAEQHIAKPVSQSEKDAESLSPPEQLPEAGPDMDTILEASNPIDQASLYRTVFDGAWEILLSDRSQSRLKAASKDDRIRDPIFSNLRCIAEGFWTASVAKPLIHPELAVPVYESKILSNLRMVWEVDVGWLEACQTTGQFVKVWYIGNHKDVVMTLKRVVAAHKTYSKERQKRCKLRGQGPVQMVAPIMFEDDGCDSTHITRLKDISGVDIHPLLMHDMSVTAKIFLHWLISKSNDPGEFPFNLSQAEDAIVHHPKSLLLCGRSGTGKTSCIVFRLLSMYYAYYSKAIAPLYSESSAALQPSDTLVNCGNHLNQVFITASPVFCARVRSYFGRLLESVTRGRLKEGLETISVSQRSDLFLLALKAAEITPLSGKSQFEEDIIDPLQTSPDVESEDISQDLIEEEMEQTLLSSVPASLLDLKPHHFPLFITYRKFVSMIRASFGLTDSTVSSDELIMPSEVDYPSFLHRYWSHMDKKVIARLEPSLVFNEIMGVIKGSEVAARSTGGCLTREQYSALSDRSFGTFRGVRDKLYDVFLEYQSVKGFERDALDSNSINEVNRAIISKGYFGPPIHEIFVDEVQDLTMAQLLPLVTICASPNNGLMFAGDTAQTIARGSAFRFQDLSSLVYRVLEARGDRSHDGILRLAASILDLLQRYFPNSIDALARDIGAVDGPLPVCFLGSDEDLRDVFGLGATSNGMNDGLCRGSIATPALEFGAEQVVLVRCEDDAGFLREKLGDSALIMTIEQSKGMEFDDVLLYSPFGGSPAGASWRVFLKEVPGNKTPCPMFSEERHNILATELKILYTGITRARQRLWIYDPNTNAREPLFSLWRALSLVEIVSSNSSRSFLSLAQKSTPQKWHKQGRVFFERRQYDAALICFRQENRLKPSEEAKERCLLTEANMNRVKGLQLAMEGKSNLASEYFKRAGILYLDVGGETRIKSSAQCFKRGGHYNLAGESFTTLSLHSEAAECYSLAHNHFMAGKSFELAKRPEDALLAFKAGNHWSEAIELISASKKAESMMPPISPTFIVRIIKIASKYYNRIRDNRMRVKIINCMDGVEEKARIFRSERLFQPLAEMYYAAGRLEESAKVWEHDVGDLKRAIIIYEALGTTTALLSAASCDVRRLWDIVFQTKQNHILAQTIDLSTAELCRETTVNWKYKLEAIANDPSCGPHHQIQASSIYRQYRALQLILDCYPGLPQKDIESVLTQCETANDSAGLFLALLSALAVSTRHRLDQETIEIFSLDKSRDIEKEERLKGAYSNAVLEMKWTTRLKDIVFRFLDSLSKQLCGYSYTEQVARDVSELEYIFGFQPDFVSPTTVRVSAMNRINIAELGLGDSGTKDDLGRTKMMVENVYLGLRSVLLTILIGAIVDLELYVRTICGKRIPQNVGCLKHRLAQGGCTEHDCTRRHFISEQFDENRLHIAVGLAELLAAARRVARYGEVHELDISRRRWLEQSHEGLRPWSERVPSNAIVTSKTKKELSSSFLSATQALLFKIWINEPKCGTSTIEKLLKWGFLITEILHNEKLMLSAYYEVLSRERLSFEIGERIFSFFTSPSPTDAIEFALNIAKDAISEYCYWDISSLITMVERAVCLAILLNSSFCILPRLWVIEAVSRFPGLILGEGLVRGAISPLMMHVKELVMDLNRKERDNTIQTRVRLSALQIMLNHASADIGEIGQLRHYSPTHFFGTGWPLWFAQPNAYAAIKSVTEAAGDKLVLIVKVQPDRSRGYMTEACAVAGFIVSISEEDFAKPLSESLIKAGLMNQFSKLRAEAAEFKPMGMEAVSKKRVMTVEEAALKIGCWYRRRKRSDRIFDRIYAQALDWLNKGLWDKLSEPVSEDSGRDVVATRNRMDSAYESGEIDANDRSRISPPEDSATACGLAPDVRGRERLYRYKYLASGTLAVRSLVGALDIIAGVLPTYQICSEDDIDLEDEVNQLQEEATSLKTHLEVTSSFHKGFDIEKLSRMIDQSHNIQAKAEHFEKRCRSTTINNSSKARSKKNSERSKDMSRQQCNEMALALEETYDLNSLLKGKKKRGDFEGWRKDKTLANSRKMSTTVFDNESKIRKFRGHLKCFEGTAFGKGGWDIFLSSHAQKQMRALFTCENYRKPLFSKLKMMAGGEWVRSIYRPMKHPLLKAPVFSTRVMRNFRILWEVDVAWLPELEVHGQFCSIVKVADNPEFPFSLSKEEYDVINSPQSVIVCGRSGTGKTSCLMFRLLSQYLSLSEDDKIQTHGTLGGSNQVFITASPGFCARIKSYFSDLVESITKGKNTTIAETTENFLDSLSMTECDSGEKLDEGVFEALSQPLLRADQKTTMDLTEDTKHRLPDALHELTRADFPLFVTYRKFLSMLWNSLMKKKENYFNADGERLFSDIDYFLFLEKYWDKMKKSLTKGVDPNLAYNEIMGIIKGSETAALSGRGYMSRDEYRQLSKRRYTTFAQARDHIYDIFSEYQRLKQRSMDMLDYVNSLNRQMKAEDIYMSFKHGPKYEKDLTKDVKDLLPHSPIDEIYVDEVQDFSMAELLLLMSVCSSPHKGLAFAGDTAQKISHGSAFRFQDLGALVYRHLEKRYSTIKTKCIQPKFMPLLVASYLSNFVGSDRSHNGILAPAAAVLDLIKKHFPESIDELPRDIGLTDGPAPLWLTSDKASHFIFLKSLSLNANQVVLVRNDKDRDELKKALQLAIVMTVEEVKAKDWTKLANSILREQRAGQKAPTPVPLSLCTELKVLYTAITRARRRLWILEPNDSEGSTFLHSMSLKSLIKITESYASIPSTSLPATSSMKEWEKIGCSFFERQQFENAAVCFENEYRLTQSKDSYKRLCTARAKFNLVNASRSKLKGKRGEALEYFRKAGSSFSESERFEEAAKCFESGEDYRAAAMFYAKICYHGKAGQCSLLAKEYLSAGKQFELAGDLPQVFQAYREGCHWPEGLNVIRDHKNEISANHKDVSPLTDAMKFIRLAARFYDERRNFFSILEALRILWRDEALVEIMREDRLFFTLSEFYSSKKLYMEEGDVNEFDIGDMDKASDAYLKCGTTGCIRATSCLVVKVWAVLAPILMKSLSDSKQVPSFEVDHSVYDDVERASHFIKLFGYEDRSLQRQLGLQGLLLLRCEDFPLDDVRQISRDGEGDDDYVSCFFALLAERRHHILNTVENENGGRARSREEESSVKLMLENGIKLFALCLKFWTSLRRNLNGDRSQDPKVIKEIQRAFGLNSRDIQDPFVKITFNCIPGLIDKNNRFGVESRPFRISTRHAFEELLALLRNWIFALVDEHDEGLKRFLKQIRICEDYFFGNYCSSDCEIPHDASQSQETWTRLVLDFGRLLKSTVSILPPSWRRHTSQFLYHYWQQQGFSCAQNWFKGYPLPIANQSPRVQEISKEIGGLAESYIQCNLLPFQGSITTYEKLLQSVMLLFRLNRKDAGFYDSLLRILSRPYIPESVACLVFGFFSVSSLFLMMTNGIKMLGLIAPVASKCIHDYLTLLEYVCGVAVIVRSKSCVHVKSMLLLVANELPELQLMRNPALLEYLGPYICILSDIVNSVSSDVTLLRESRFRLTYVRALLRLNGVFDNTSSDRFGLQEELHVEEVVQEDEDVSTADAILKAFHYNKGIPKIDRQNQMFEDKFHISKLTAAAKVIQKHFRLHYRGKRTDWEVKRDKLFEDAKTLLTKGERKTRSEMLYLGLGVQELAKLTCDRNRVRDRLESLYELRRSKEMVEDLDEEVEAREWLSKANDLHSRLEATSWLRGYGDISDLKKTIQECSSLQVSAKCMLSARIDATDA
ncbi:hypothetical protein HDU67_007420 [Dinochytrium kinnereticum]|nr:hypothetical protein HDU67_007420 [Dinochytrium kinnereticum]